MGIDGSVDFHGRLEGEALAESYRHATVFALPSVNEAFGMVIAEAMASGLPVVSVRVGGIPTLVDDGRNGLLVPPRDPHALAGALRTILTDPEKAALFGRTGRQIACDRLSWERQVSLMDTVLTEAVKLFSDGSINRRP
jgi:rhamnosyl/mannosyltransferase